MISASRLVIGKNMNSKLRDFLFKVEEQDLYSFPSSHVAVYFWQLEQ